MTLFDGQFDDERNAIDSALRKNLAALPEKVRDVATYHFGWTDQDGTPVEGRQGKRLRPLLTLLIGRGLGADSEQVLPAAVAVELIHNFSLLHDDVIDEDEYRRARRTAWAAFGRPAAILVGDSLHALAFEVLGGMEVDRLPTATALLGNTVNRLIRGQMSDVHFERRSRVELNECTVMATDKTASLLETATLLGALSASDDHEVGQRAGAFGYHLGLLFQHVDDLLGIWGDPAKTGKSTYSDLANRKKSLPIVAALESSRAEATLLRDYYYRDTATDDASLADMARLVEECGGRDASRESARVHHRAACDALEDLPLEETIKAQLHTVATDLINRES
ncbi:polyprenyl synthetase family protein [Haloglycomyces albus]|uniref:polyprenyl synthetase family protein n=1 Tax=Haloglycomyces albus TaxID=526067 RepID=UPI0004A455C3|nr:polyprenyl synthetase family protein [Haloglycomyces albus]